jgi:hypothetical protein
MKKLHIIGLLIFLPFIFAATTTYKVPHMIASSGTWDPGSLADGVGETKAFTVTGAAVGDAVIYGSGVDLQDINCSCYVQATNTVECRLQNESTGTIDLGTSTWNVLVVKP